MEEIAVDDGAQRRQRQLVIAADQVLDLEAAVFADGLQRCDDVRDAAIVGERKLSASLGSVKLCHSMRLQPAMTSPSANAIPALKDSVAKVSALLAGPCTFGCSSSVSLRHHQGHRPDNEPG